MSIYRECVGVLRGVGDRGCVRDAALHLRTLGGEERWASERGPKQRTRVCIDSSEPSVNSRNEQCGGGRC